MDRIYRVRQGMGGRYVVERDNALYWLDGDVFGEYRLGCRNRRAAARLPGAGDALEDHGHRPQLQGPRRRDEEGVAGRAAAVHQAAHLGHRSRGGDSHSGVARANRSRSGNGRGHRPARLARQGARGDGLRPRRHLPVRRHRPRAAGQGRAGTRAPRASTRSRRSARASPSASTRPSSRSRAGSTARSGSTPTRAS